MSLVATIAEMSLSLKVEFHHCFLHFLWAVRNTSLSHKIISKLTMKLFISYSKKP